MFEITLNDDRPPSPAMNDRDLNPVGIRSTFDRNKHDLKKLIHLWRLNSPYLQRLILNEFESRIDQSEHVTELLGILQAADLVREVRDHLGPRFATKLDLFRTAGQTCELAVWKSSIPGLRALGLLEKNKGFYKEVP